MYNTNSPSYDPKKFAINGMIIDCFDILLEADDLREFTQSTFNFQKIEKLHLDPSIIDVEDLTIYLSLSLIDINPDKHYHSRILHQLSGPLHRAIAQQDASPMERKVQFLVEAGIGFQLNKANSKEFIYRSHKMQMHCLKVDMLITHYQLVCRLRLPS